MPLTDREIQRVEEACNNTMLELGYTPIATDEFNAREQNVFRRHLGLRPVPDTAARRAVRDISLDIEQEIERERPVQPIGGGNG